VGPTDRAARVKRRYAGCNGVAPGCNGIATGCKGVRPDAAALHLYRPLAPKRDAVTAYHADRPRGFWSGPWGKVLERLATSDKTTIVIEKQPDGKMRITSGSWNGEKIFLKDQVIEVRHANALGCIARKTKAPDEWDAPIQAPAFSNDRRCRRRSLPLAVVPGVLRAAGNAKESQRRCVSRANVFKHPPLS